MTGAAPFAHPDPRVSLALFAAHDAALFAEWGPALERAVEPVELGAKTRSVLVVALDSIVHWSPAVTERHIDEAFDAGASIAELIEAIMHLAMLEGGAHTLHWGLEGLENVILERGRAGKPTPRNGVGLKPEDMKGEAPWPVPPAFPYQSPSPRMHVQVLGKYMPKLHDAWQTWNQARFSVREELTRKIQEQLWTVCDVAIYYPEPLLDHHLHAAFETGSTAQELLEVTMIAATAVQGARYTNFQARNLEGGVHAIHHGVCGISRVLRQRESRGLLAPRDRTKPRTAPAFLPSTSRTAGAKIG